MSLTVRGHWAVENQLHWVLDVVFGEDQGRAHTGDAVANLGLLRRLPANTRSRMSVQSSIVRYMLHG